MNIKISLLHPSFGRPEQAFRAYKEWGEAAENPGQVEYVLGLDDNDLALDEYLFWFKEPEKKFARKEIIVAPTRNIVQSFNNMVLCLSKSSQLFVGTADDMSTVPYWDTKLWQVIPDMSKPSLIHVDDGMMPFDHPYTNYLIVNRAFYERVGYLLCPEYDGVSADVDISFVARKLGAMVDAPHLKFQHKHYCLGLAEMDPTYARHNTPEKTETNRKIFEARKERDFDL
jgi:hypothetical protein